MPDKIIYLDNAATTRTDPDVLKEMLPYMKEVYGNPSGKYSLGYEASKAVRTAREQVAALINAEPDEIYFTASGTEGNNTVIKSAIGAKNLHTSGQEGCFNGSTEKKTVISTNVEHKSVLNSINAIKYIDPVFLKPEKDGRIIENALLEALEKVCGPDSRPGNGIVSIMTVNNETGAVNPIKELSQISHSHGFVMHTDAVQAAGHMELDVKELGIDYLTASGHKLYGPKGVGFMFVKRGTGLCPLIDGGGQERGLRSGTENVAGIIGLGKACEIAKSRMEETARQETELGRYLKDRLFKTVPDIAFNGDSDRIISLMVKGVNGTSLALRLDMEHICVSTGSACSLGSGERSHVLKSMGLTDDEADCTIRISLGKYNTLEEMDYTAQRIAGIASEIREIMGYKA